MNLPPLTVIIPIRNGEEYIYYIVDQLKNINYPAPIEAIFINDGSDDNTLGMLSRYAPSINGKILNYPEWRGYNKTMIDAIEAASNDWVTVASVNDPINPDGYKLYMEQLLLCKNPETALINLPVKVYQEETGQLIQEWEQLIFEFPIQYIFEEFKRACGLICSIGVCYHKEHFKQAFKESDKILNLIEVDGLPSCIDTFVINYMILYELIKNVIATNNGNYAKFTVSSKDSNSRNTQNRINDLPVMLAFCLAKLTKMGLSSTEALDIVKSAPNGEFISNFSIALQKFNNIYSSI